MKRGLFITVNIIFLCGWIGFAAEQQESVDAGQEVVVEEQLEINKNVLLNGSDEQIRVKAASLILESDNPVGRQVLLEILSNSDNQPARTAICQAIAARRGKLPIPDSEEFIGPLLSFLTNQRDEASVRLAAEALLVFDYGRLEQPLLAKINDKSLPIEARLNVIQALRLQPDIRAIVQLVELLDNSNEQIVASAGETLNSLAIPAVDADKATRRQMVEEIQRIGKEEFLHYWRMREEYEGRIEELRNERDVWKQKYLTTLDELYDGLDAQGSAKIEFLSRYLTATEPVERLWAVSRVSQWLRGTESKTKVRSELGPLLIKLISDENGQVRLNAAKVLSLMPELNSAETLLARTKVEQDDEIRTEQFVALGQACRYAFSPQSPSKPNDMVRIETLDLATEYLMSQEPDKAQRGAQVIRNLLEHDGLNNEQVAVYLNALVERYERQESGDELRGELLNTMAVLCSQSVYREQIGQIFREHFLTALDHKNDRMREAAVKGLININKTTALRRLRKDFVNDKNANVRKQLIALAEEIGTIEDLTWLSEKIDSNSEGAAAFKAMLRIFESSEVDVLDKWIEPLERKGATPAMMIAFLEIAERKAQAQEQVPMLNKVRYRLAKLFAETSEHDKAKEYYGNAIKAASGTARKDELRAELLELYLQDGQLKSASSLIANRLLEEDINRNSPIAEVLVAFVDSSPQQAGALVEQLLQIEIENADAKPAWQNLLNNLAKRVESFPAPEDANLPVSDEETVSLD